MEHTDASGRMWTLLCLSHLFLTYFALLASGEAIEQKTMTREQSHGKNRSHSCSFQENRRCCFCEHHNLCVCTKMGPSAHPMWAPWCYAWFASGAQVTIRVHKSHRGIAQGRTTTIPPTRLVTPKGSADIYVECIWSCCVCVQICCTCVMIHIIIVCVLHVSYPTSCIFGVHIYIYIHTWQQCGVLNEKHGLNKHKHT